MLKSLENKSVRDVFLQGLLASSAPIFFGAVAKRLRRDTVFVLSDADEAGYFLMTSTTRRCLVPCLWWPNKVHRVVGRKPPRRPQNHRWLVESRLLKMAPRRFRP